MKLSEAGDHALACQLAEWAWQAEPEPSVDSRAQVYKARAKTETSLMAKSIFAAAAKGDS